MQWEVVIVALSAQRRPAKEATELYRETEASVERRQAETLRRKQQTSQRARGIGRPTKRDRRELARLKGQL